MFSFLSPSRAVASGCPLRLTGCLAAVLAACTGGAWAQELPPADVQVLAGPCAACHGPDGRSAGAIPSIAGLPEQTAFQRMMDLRDGKDASATIMPRLLAGYDEAQIRALARWFAEVTP